MLNYLITNELQGQANSSRWSVVNNYSVMLNLFYSIILDDVGYFRVHCFVYVTLRRLIWYHGLHFLSYDLKKTLTKTNFSNSLKRFIQGRPLAILLSDKRLFYYDITAADVRAAAMCGGAQEWLAGRNNKDIPNGLINSLSGDHVITYLQFSWCSCWSISFQNGILMTLQLHIMVL